MAVRDWFKRPAQKQQNMEQKSRQSAPFVSYHTSGRVAWSARDDVSLSKTGFLGNPVGFRAVKLISEAAAAVPLILQDADRRYDAHPINSLLDLPNALQARSTFFETLYAQLLLSGDAFVEAVTDDQGHLSALHVLRSDRVQLVPGDDGWPVAYDYKVGSKRIRFDVSDGVSPICHIKSFHPQDDHYGLSPMQAAAQALDVHNAASRWSKALLDNAARPSGALVYQGPDGYGTLGPDQYDRLVSEIEANHQGARNAGRPMLLEGGLDWKPMGFSPSDMEFHKTKEAAAREISVAFGVPPMMLGLQGDATYANYQEANRAFYRLTIIPLVQRVSAHISSWLGVLSGDEFKLSPDLDQIPALSAERDAHWRRVSDADFLTDAEKRRLLGLPAQDGIAHD